MAQLEHISAMVDSARLQTFAQDSGLDDRIPVVSQRQPLSIAGMRARYLVALGLLAALSFAAFTALQVSIGEQERDAAIVNVAGRQRMLSQRLALDCLRFTQLADESDRIELRASIEANCESMRANHHDLVHGNPERGLPGTPPATVQALYAADDGGLNALIEVYLAAVATVIGNGEDQSAALKTVLELGPNELVQGLDSAVNLYQADSERRIRNIARLELGVFVATICTLILEALLIFGPMIRRIQKERQGMLRAERNIRAILNSASDGLAVTSPTGQILWATPSTEAILGMSVQDMVGRSLHELLHDALAADPEQGQSTDWAGDGVQQTVPIQRPDGHRAWLELNEGILEHDLGRFAIISIHESTASLEHYNRQLEQKNQDLAQFASIASHDLKAPLRAISNLSSWLEEDLGDNQDPEIRRYLDLLKTRVRRMEQLVRGIHFYATTGGTQQVIEDVPMRELVQEVFDDCTIDARFDLKIRGEFPDLPTDRILAGRVFTNLISNAIKHHHRGSGTITVCGRLERELWHCDLIDDGPGIPLHSQDRVFGIFQTLGEKDGESLGLGLALVKRIMVDLEGSVGLQSNGSEGSCFTTSWPLVRAREMAA